MILLQGFLLGLSAGAQPGAFQAYLISRALRDGWGKSWSAALAPLISDSPIILTTLLVLSTIPGWMVRGLRAAGGLFLIYLAWGVMNALRRPRSALSSGGDAGQSAGQTNQSIFQAALLNLLNPAPWIFWSTVAGPAFLAGWRTSPVLGVGFVISFYATMLSLLLATVGLFSVAARLDLRVVRLLNAVSGVALLGFGLYQLWSAVVGG